MWREKIIYTNDYERDTKLFVNIFVTDQRCDKTRDKFIFLLGNVLWQNPVTLNLSKKQCIYHAIACELWLANAHFSATVTALTTWRAFVLIAVSDTVKDWRALHVENLRPVLQRDNHYFSGRHDKETNLQIDINKKIGNKKSVRAYRQNPKLLPILAL